MGRKVLVLLAFLALVAGRVEAQTVRTLCASGCTYTLTEANVTTAINASVGGDSILLQENTTTDVALTLPTHTGASMVTIRTGVTAAGALLPAAQFPAANVRMTPALAASARLAVLRAKTNNLPAIGTSASMGGNGFWTLKHLAITGNAYGGEALIRLGSDNNNVGEQDSIARIPTDFTLEQLYLYGNPVSGQYRGVRTHANNVTIKDSSFKDFKSNAEGQVIWANSFNTGLTVTNNYLEGGAERLLIGGSGGCCHPDITVASAVDASHFTLSGRTDLFVGRWISVFMASTGIEERVQVTACGTAVDDAACTSNAITVAPALSGTPANGSDVDWGLIPADILIEKNHFDMPVSWRGAVVGTPQSVTASTATTGGTLAASTGGYCYRIVARQPAAVNTTFSSAASTEVCQPTTGATSTITLTWAAVTNATEYRVYGRSAGGQNVYWTVTAPTVTYTDTGATGTTGNVTTGSGSTWYVKNILELKNARRVTINGNVFEHIWEDNQDGYAIVFTPANTGDGNDSTGFESVAFTNNIVRNAGAWMQLMGRGGGTARAKSITASNNLIYDIGTAWTTNAVVRSVLVTTYPPNAYWPNNTVSNGPLDTTFNHNTIVQIGGNAMLWFDLYKTTEQPAQNFVWKNSIGIKLSNGMFGANSCVEGADCFTDHTSGTSAFQASVVADASCGGYPVGTFCPTFAQLQGEFQDYAAKNFALRLTSAYHNAATDGTDIGANVATITPLTNIALSGDNTGGTPPVAPPSVTTTILANGTVGATYTDVLTGTCPAPTCTWGVTGTLPTGVVLTGTSSTSATLTGPAQASGTFPITATLTDVGGQVGSQSFSITIAEVIVSPVVPSPDPDVVVPPVNTSRPERFNLDEGVHYRRATEPSADGQPVRSGDVWGDISCTSPLLRLLIATSPGVDWRALAFRPTLTPTTITTAGVATYTAAALTGGLLLRDPNGGNRSDVTPTAALLVAAIPCAAVGDVLEFDIRNTADAAETITVTAGTGVTLSGTMTIAQNNTKRFKAVVTDATSGGEAVTVFSIGSFVH